ncbi:universal stress protein [Roseimaritima sediminicola]|uniref:universal stress protein n=1 Tax=Roseimaritima sediminicola TaxID=2662066 RepID=UPI0012983BB8|nr:universal stress protein [Roseimaritima sediminicola]
MRSIVVATDFSERSDRAIRRAKLLAREFESHLHLVHVVDDDQPRVIVQAKQTASTELLAKLTQTLGNVDRVQCDFRVALGKPFLAITQAARELDADLIVIGPHRRQLLRNILVGTTAERTIRTADRPVLMANGVPSGLYRRALVASDLSDESQAMIHQAQELRLMNRLGVSLLHVYSAPGSTLVNRTSMSEAEKQSYLDSIQNRSMQQTVAFMQRVGIEEMTPLVQHATANIAETICDTAREMSADLVVLGTCGRSVFARALMGSVTEGVLRVSEQDVLAIPPALRGN